MPNSVAYLPRTLPRYEEMVAKAIIRGADSGNIPWSPFIEQTKLFVDPLRYEALSPEEKENLLKSLYLIDPEKVGEKLIYPNYKSEDQKKIIIEALQTASPIQSEFVDDLISKIANLRNKFNRDSIANEFIQLTMRPDFESFLSELQRASEGRSYALLPIFMIYASGGKLDDQLANVFTDFRGEIKNKFSGLLNIILKCQIGIKRLGIDSERQTAILHAMIPSKDSSDYLKEFIARMKMVAYISDYHKGFLLGIDDFSSKALCNLALRQLLEYDLIDTTIENYEQKFIDTFLSSRDPTAIFAYASTNGKLLKK